MMSELERRPNESEFEHHKRLLTGKLIDRTIGEDYSTLSTYLYGKRYAEDVARRMAYGSARTMRLLEDEQIGSIDNLEIVREIAKKQHELAKERNKFFDQRREYNNLVRSTSREEHIMETLVESAKNLTETVGVIYADSQHQFKCNGVDNEAVLFLSDWHYGMTCENAFNTYNTEECIKRVRKVVDSVKKKLVLHNVGMLHVVVLGDMIHGAIHTSARVASEELVCDQLMQVSEILAQSIEELAEYTEDVVVYSTYGNHGRTVQEKADSIHADNMEKIIPWWLKQRFAGRSDIHIVDRSDNEFIFVSTCGHDICAVHGDLDPIRNATTILPQLLHKTYGVDVEYIVLGDKHHRESMNSVGVTSIICGALCGSDDYANEKRKYSTPEQLLIITNEEDCVDAEYHIKC